MGTRPQGPARRPLQQQAGTGHGRPERAPGRRRHDATPQPHLDCIEAVTDDTTANQTTTSHSWCGRSGRESHDCKANDDEGSPRLQPPDHMHAGDALRQLTMHISTNDLHCCKPARLLQRAPSGGRPRSRPPATAPPRIDPPHQQ
jgi:hypothetical protein